MNGLFVPQNFPKARKSQNILYHVVVVVVVAYFILSRLEQIAISSFFRQSRPTVHVASRNGTPSLASLKKDGGVGCFDCLS